MRSQCASLAILTLKRAQVRPAQHALSAAFSSTLNTALQKTIDEYPEDPLNAPLNPIQSVTKTVPPPPIPPPAERPLTGPEEQALKAQAIFGSRDPGEREAELKKASTTIAAGQDA